MKSTIADSMEVVCSVVKAIVFWWISFGNQRDMLIGQAMEE